MWGDTLLCPLLLSSFESFLHIVVATNSTMPLLLLQVRLCIVLLVALLACGDATSSASSLLQRQRRRRRQHHQQQDTLDTVVNDLAKLENCPTPLVSATHSRRDSSYTRNWSHDDWDLHHCAPLQRYRRHLSSWIRSPTAIAVLPVVAVVALWAVVVVVLTSGAEATQAFLKKSSFSAAVGTLTAPVSLLLTLRTNRALDRLQEARRAWGVLIKSTTTLAGLIASYVLPHDSTTALLLARYLALTGWAMKGVFMVEDDGPLLRTALPKAEVDWITQQQQSTTDTVTAIVFRTRATLASLDYVPTAALQAMEARLEEMETSLGICKRILGSPIPPTFSRHSSRILCLYLTL